MVIFSTKNISISFPLHAASKYVIVSTWENELLVLFFNHCKYFTFPGKTNVFLFFHNNVNCCERTHLNFATRLVISIVFLFYFWLTNSCKKSILNQFTQHCCVKYQLIGRHYLCFVLLAVLSIRTIFINQSEIFYCANLLLFSKSEKIFTIRIENQKSP